MRDPHGLAVQQNRVRQHGATKAIWAPSTTASLAIRFIETTSRDAIQTRGTFDRIGGIKQEYLFRVS